MGVKRRFVLNTESAIYLGPAAFHFLICLYQTYQKQGYFDIPFCSLKMPRGGWRKSIVFLYTLLKGALGPSVGTLKELRTSNPRTNREYRDAVQWVQSYSPRRKTPRYME